jgi:DNA-binding beta-propeller fold protein YncE
MVARFVVALGVVWSLALIGLAPVAASSNGGGPAVVDTIVLGGGSPAGVAANPQTGRLYVTNSGSGSVTVIQDAP